MRAARHACPVCGHHAPLPEDSRKDSPFPFCSPTCKLVDLGRWLDGKYRIPGPLTSEGEGEGEVME
jgi:endogenous inhibitor of DNA gyrase (YacG/DUF329 family)